MRPPFFAFAALLMAGLAWPGPAPRADEGEEFVKPTFVRLDPFVIPVYYDRRLMGHFDFQAMLELEPGVDTADLMPYEPRLRDAIITDMKHYADRHPRMLDRVDLVRVKAVLQAAVDRVTGGGMVREVLFRSVYQRPNPRQVLRPSG